MEVTKNEKQNVEKDRARQAQLDSRYGNTDLLTKSTNDLKILDL